MSEVFYREWLSALAERDILQRELDAARTDLAAANSVINDLVKSEREVVEAVGMKYLLDPPDGGDVKLWEGVERIKADLAAAHQAFFDSNEALQSAISQRDAARADLAAANERDMSGLVAAVQRAEAAEAREREAKELLRELLPKAKSASFDLLARIDAALTASPDDR